MDDRLAYAHALPNTSFLDIASVGDDIIRIPGFGSYIFLALLQFLNKKYIYHMEIVNRFRVFIGTTTCTVVTLSKYYDF